MDNTKFTDARIIAKLLIENTEYKKYLEALEVFEAELIECDECWDTESGLPTITKEFYDKWIQLQHGRNELLGRNIDKARTYDEIMKGVEC